ncbi:MAG: hypothetical protein KA761_10710 [Gemmatimonadaceae bacterium]|jgi:hypothetical protein|nr:hypothetical protein [Gemmatimonadaceae bacterium]
MTDALLPPDPLDDKDAKKREKDARRLEAERGLLEPAFRYRAMQNAVEMTQDLIELADRKARFALVIISVLNAVALVVVVRGGEAVLPRDGVWGAAITAEVVIYVAVTVWYIFQAIEALRPRGAAPTDVLPTVVQPGASMRMLFHGDIVRRPRAEYRRVWDELRMDNLTTELADQLHILSGINQDKYAALARLYRGVSVMTGLLTVTLVSIAAYHLVR